MLLVLNFSDSKHTLRHIPERSGVYLGVVRGNISGGTTLALLREEDLEVS
jgi:hypothetical protein